MARAIGGARSALCIARLLWLARIRHRRRLDELWCRPAGRLSPSRRLRCTHPQGREAGRPAGRAVHESGARHQSQDCKGAGSHLPATAARPRRRGDRMRRRDFITLLGGASVAWPLAARAQQAAMPVVGFLSSASPDSYTIRLRAFRQGLKEAGYVEGQNAAIEYGGAEAQNGRLAVVAPELVHRQVDVIVAGGGTPCAVAAKAATGTIPIIVVVAVDPVAVGFVASLDKPGGNITGVTNLNVEIGPKRLELMHELLPSVTVIGVLVNPSNPALFEPFVQSLEAAAKRLRLELHVLNASDDRDFEPVFAALDQLKVGALVIGPDVFFNSHIEQIAALTIGHALPTVYQYRPFVEAGGLLSYGSDETETYHLVGAYTGRVLKGEKPANLPVVQSTKVELIINLKTAKALGLTVPLPLAGRADEVIE